jgi:CRISPR-associated endonuclease/helicase Cas3
MSSSFQLKSHPNRFLVEHLSGVAEACRRLAPSRIFFDELDLPEIREISYVIGASHDVGKATKYFQEYVLSGRVASPLLKSHGPLSSLYAYYAASRMEFKHGSILPVYAQLTVLSHHGILQTPTTVATKMFHAKYLLEQIRAIQHIEELDAALGKMHLPSFSEFADEFAKENDLLIMKFGKAVAALSKENRSSFKESLLPFFAINLNLSVLVDADRMDAAQLDFPKRERIRTDNVENYVKNLSERSKKAKEVNLNVIKGRDLLFEILASKAAKMTLDKRILSITAPTGYGKTLAGLHFALKLRDRLLSRDFNSRIIYVAPFLSIIDQNLNVIRKALDIDPCQSNLLLAHHHLAEMNYKPSDEDESLNPLDSELLIEGWNSEIIVTTFIQFFYSILGIRASQLRRFHNLEGSIVILDEVQSIPHEYWGLVRNVIRFLSERFRMYIILMTATQPLIFDQGEVDELAKNFPQEFQKTRVNFQIRTNPKIPIDMFCEEVNGLIYSAPQKSFLIVLNTVRSATQVYQSLDAGRENYYLSASLVPKQRSERLKIIVDALRNRQPLTLVSTQVVEAGVDLDFDMAIRDIGPIDSIIQIAGRCNRNGSRDPSHSFVYVYDITDSEGREFGQPIYGPFLINKTKEVFAEIRTDLDPLQLSLAYYQKVRMGASPLESNKLLGYMRQLDYQGLANFRLIEDQDSVSVYVELNQEAEDIWQRYEMLTNRFAGLQAKEEFLRIRQIFYNYVVNVPERNVSGLDLMKGFYRVPNSRLYEFYDCETGFRR